MPGLWSLLSRRQSSPLAADKPSRVVPPRPPELVVLPEAGEFPPLPFLLTRDGCHTLRIRVRPDGTVEVKTPRRVSSMEAMRAVERKRIWIEGKREFFRSRPQPAQHRYEPGEAFYYLGRPFLLRLEESSAPASLSSTDGHTLGPTSGRTTGRLPRARLQGHELVVCGSALTPVRVGRAIEVWRNGLEQRLFVRRLLRLHHHACQVLDDSFPLPSLRIRALKRRWGSCSRHKPSTVSAAVSAAVSAVTTSAAVPASSAVAQAVSLAAVHEVTLARQLSAAPLECVDYVILHELCHMRRMDHGPLFHALLRRLLPDATARARRLHLWNIEHAKD